MSKRIIFNDNELAINEDVQAAQDWVSRDLGRVLEGVYRGSLNHRTAASGSFGGVILSGFGVSLSSSNLEATISPGLALFEFPSTDTSSGSVYRLGALESTVTVPFKAPPLVSVWSLIEISMSEVVTSEVRSIKSPTGLTSASVPKISTYGISVRSRAGDSTFGNLPSMGSNLDYLPLWGVRVSSSDLSLSGNHIIDLRKLFSASDSPTGRFNRYAYNGFSRSVSLRVSGGVVISSRNVATVDGYAGPLQPSVTTENTGTVSADPTVGLSDVAGALAPGTWLYLYAYRPSPTCGYTTLCFSHSPPSVAGTPFSSFSAPFPFGSESSVTSSALYMGSFLTYADTASGDTLLLPSFKSGTYTRQTYRAVIAADPLDAVTGGEIASATPVGPSATPVFDVKMLSSTLVPALSTAVRISVRLLSSSANGPSSVFRFSLLSPSSSLDIRILTTVELGPGESRRFELDVPFVSESSLLQVKTNASDAANSVALRLVGFYEAV